MEKDKWSPSMILALMDERDKRYTERFDAQQKAIGVAEEQAEKWRANANEWRTAMNDRERNFLSKSMGYVLGALTALVLILTLVDRFTRVIP